MTLHHQQVMLDKTDAPPGYYPVPKEQVRPKGNLLSPNHNENICHECDWRAEAQDKICRCFPDKRADGISVVFKRVRT